MLDKEIIETNKKYWNEHADQWFGTTALPQYGVRFVTEDDLHLFGDVRGKSMLEICCGSGHSLLYNANKGAKELWGVDISQTQLENAAKLLAESEIPVNQVALMVGFQTPRYFSQCFRQLFGVLPTEYRNGLNTNPST